MVSVQTQDQEYLSECVAAACFEGCSDVAARDEAWLFRIYVCMYVCMYIYIYIYIHLGQNLLLKSLNDLYQMRQMSAKNKTNKQTNTQIKSLADLYQMREV